MGETISLIAILSSTKVEDKEKLKISYSERPLKHKVIVNSKISGINELDKWISENIEGFWSVNISGGVSDEHCYIWEYSFDNLQIATLFRLRF